MTRETVLQAARILQNTIGNFTYDDVLAMTHGRAPAPQVGVVFQLLIAAKKIQPLDQWRKLPSGGYAQEFRIDTRS